MHAGHSGNPSGDPDAETHFKVEVVSSQFEGKMAVARHRMVYSLLDQEIKDGQGLPLFHLFQLSTLSRLSLFVAVVPEPT